MHEFSFTIHPNGHHPSSVSVFRADADLGSSPQEVFPTRIAGRLKDSSPLQLLAGSEPEIKVFFEGKGYRFSKLDEDGCFELSLIQP